MSKVCHLTSVHPPFDIRIFYKQCHSLVNNGFDVCLIAPIDEFLVKDGINVFPIKLPKSRLKRMLVVNQRMFKLALNTNAKLFHFHDPELLACGVLLKLFRKKVIFDVHENIILSFKTKSWKPKWMIPFIQFFYFIFERFALLFFDALILAEESYLNHYPNKKSEVILNYPLLKITEKGATHSTDAIRFIYVGGVSENRGIWEMIRLIEVLLNNGIQCTLTIVGKIYSKLLEKEIRNYILDNELGSVIHLKGVIDFIEVELYLHQADIGLALLKPIANYKESLPTKIFEYMQTGLPVITNNFPLYIKYVEDNGAGVCIDIEHLTEAMPDLLALLKNKDQIVNMGNRGIELVKTKYNWNSEETKLINLYDKILS